VEKRRKSKKEGEGEAKLKTNAKGAEEKRKARNVKVVILARNLHALLRFVR
jgi:hypothetical protein